MTKKNGTDKPKTITIAEGADLAPDLTPAPEDVAYWFWLGLLPSAPESSLTLAGLSFPKATYRMVHHGAMGQNTRLDQAGALQRLTRAQVERIAFGLRHRVVRPIPTGAATGAAAETDAGQVLDQYDKRRTRAVVIYKPSDEEIEAFKAKGRPRRRYQPRPDDRPLAEFLYCVPILEKGNPRPRNIDVELPQPVNETGLVWPEDLAPVPDGSVPAREDDGWGKVKAAHQPRREPQLPYDDAAISELLS